MNAKANGTRIEELIIKKYKLKEDLLGFDALKNDAPVEIKGCLMTHKNGVDHKGNDKTTDGRFWIDNRAHRLLLDVKGLYVFAVYMEGKDDLIIHSSMIMSAKSINRLIGDGANTKIRWRRIFPQLFEGVVL